MKKKRIQETSMPPEEYRGIFIRVTNKIPMWGCGVSKNVEACITKRLEEALAYRQGQLEKAESTAEKRGIEKNARAQ